MTSLFAFWNLAGDTAFWLTWGGLIIGMFTQPSDMTILIPLVGLGALIAQALANKLPRLRWLGLAAVLPLLYHAPLLRLLLVLPPSLYLGYCIYANRLLPDFTVLYYRFSAKTTLTMLGGFLAVMSGRVWIFQCAIICLAVQLFLMRVFRHSEESHQNRQLIALELGFLGVFCGICLALSQNFVLRAGFAVGQFLMEWLVAPILTLFVYVLFLALSLLNILFGWLFRGDINFPAEAMQQAFDNAETFLPAQEPGEANPLVRLLLIAVGAVLFLALAWYIFRYLRQGSGQWNLSKPQAEEPAAVPEEVSSSLPGILDRSPEAKIRRTYAAYCRWVSRQGQKIKPHHTTLAVNALAELSDNPQAAELRELYLRARYTAHAQLTAADARRAGTLFRQLRDTQK